MKKIILAVFALLACLLSFSACKDEREKPIEEQQTEQQSEATDTFEESTEETTPIDEPLTYKLVEPSREERDSLEEEFKWILGTRNFDYDSSVENIYEELYHMSSFDIRIVPEYGEKIEKYIAPPTGFDEHTGNPYWYEFIISDIHLDHYKYDAKFVDWLIEGVWNGKVDHDNTYQYDDGSVCCYKDGYYCSTGVTFDSGTADYSAKVWKISYGWDNKYEVSYSVLRDGFIEYGTAVMALKEASNGFRFWSVYSINYNSKYRTEAVYGVPKELYEEYGESVINAEEDDYSYIRINFDESREISGYCKIDEGVIIDSNGKVYSEIEDESILEMPGSRYPDIPEPEGVDYIYDSPYNSDLLKFSKDGKYGYLNTDGEIVIEAQFDEASDFSEGLAAVCREIDGCLEYINENGETVLKLEDADGYINIFTLFPDEPNCDFSDGVARIFTGDGHYCIDKEGNRLNVKNPVGMYKNGLIVVDDPETDLQGYADINGNIVIPCKYIWARDFLPCGVALVFTADYYEPVIDAYYSEMRYCGYVNKNGEEIIPLEFYTPYYVGASGLYPMPSEKDGIINVYKEGFNYFYRYDGTLLGKKPHMMKIPYGDEWYNINLAEYWQWVNDGKPMG